MVGGLGVVRLYCRLTIHKLNHAPLLCRTPTNVERRPSRPHLPATPTCHHQTASGCRRDNSLVSLLRWAEALVYTGFPLENIGLGHTTYTSRPSSQPGKLFDNVRARQGGVLSDCWHRSLQQWQCGCVCILHIRDFLLYSVRNMWATPTTTITITGRHH